MSNLIKWGAVYFQGEEKRVIDSNEIVAKRLGVHVRPDAPQDEPESGQDAQEDGMDEALFGGSPVDDSPTPEELLEQARQEIAERKAAAEDEIAKTRESALQEAREQGYREGCAQAQEKAEQEAAAAAGETEKLRHSLQDDYEKKLQEMEAAVIEEMTAIYDHVFNAGLKEHQGILYHLLDTALHRIDSGREFIVRVSPADYGYINERREKLREGLPSATLDIVSDVMMKQGEGMIETGGGIFDCSIDVELKELKERIRMLARGGET